MNTLIVMKKTHPRHLDSENANGSNQRERAAMEQQYYDEYGSMDILLIHRILNVHQKLMALLRIKR